MISLFQELSKENERTFNLIGRLLTRQYDKIGRKGAGQKETVYRLISCIIDFVLQYYHYDFGLRKLELSSPPS